MWFCFTKTLWSDSTSLSDVTTDQRARRFNSKRLGANSDWLTSRRWISPSQAICNWKQNTWKLNTGRLLKPTYRELQSNSYSNVFFFTLRKLRPSCERLNIWWEPLFPEWLEDSCLLQSCRHTALWHSLLSRLRAMWHHAPLNCRQRTSPSPPARWKGCKLHFMAANPVANGTLSWVHVAVDILLAGAGFVFLPPLAFFPSS